MSPEPLPELWAERIRAAPEPRWAERGLEALLKTGADLAGLQGEVPDRLVRLLGSSPEAGRWLEADPSLVAVLRNEELLPERSGETYRKRLAAPEAEEEPAEVFRGRLRRVRRRELLRIVAREALGAAPIEATAREVSGLAEAAVEEALRWAGEALASRFGRPVGVDGLPNRACVLGMGKLGGGELNLSSDVDLIFLYRTGRGTTTGGLEGALEPRAYFAKLVALVTEALGRVTEDGLVFRVDLGLRPEGRNGEPAQPLGNAALYYQSWGQTWERAALLKARPVAGDRALGEVFLREVEPFVYRRSLDYTTVEDMKQMKRRIDHDAARHPGGATDLKLGRGGIREVEFFVQALQLIHGGKAPEVRSANTLVALGRLAAAGAVEEAVAQRLGRSYRFLRTLEHAVQSLHFLQTHRLPAGAEELAALGRRLGFADDPAAGLLGALDEVRAEVHGAYGRLFHGAARAWEEDPQVEEARVLLALEPDDPLAPATLREAGFRRPDLAAEGLRLLAEGPRRGRPSPRARRVLERIGPFLVGAVCRTPDPDRALRHLAEFLVASGARASYLALLEENPATAKLLLDLFGTSDFLSRYLVGRPELLDELVLGSYAVPEKSSQAMAAELGEVVAVSPGEEEWLDGLRRFRNTEFLRIALNDLWGTLSPEQVGLQVTRVAEACLEEAYRGALARLVAKYGEPFETGGEPARFAVLGLGKLGGRELDYHSDLDVVFLYSDAGTTRTPRGSPGLSNGEFFARLAQRTMSALATRTREGIAFRMDARLRPSGQGGPLVASFASFETYHRGEARLWERLALVKLRAVAADTSLGESTEKVARSLLYAAPPAEDPRRGTAEMRERIEMEVGREAGGRVHLKAGEGGLVDVQFTVQALQLLHGWRSADLQNPNTEQALAALRGLGLLSGDAGEALAAGYRFMRRVEARLRLLQERPADALPRDPDRLLELARGLGYEGAGAGAALLADVEKHRRRVREAYAAVLLEGKP